MMAEGYTSYNTWIPCVACVDSEGTSDGCHWCSQSGIMTFGDYLRRERALAMMKEYLKAEQARYMAERYNFVVARPGDLMLGVLSV